MTELTLKLIIILVPGGLGALIVQKLTIHKEWTPFTYVVNAVMLGLFSYLLLQTILIVSNFCSNLFSGVAVSDYRSLQIWNSIADSVKIPYNEVLGASGCGIFLGFLGSYIDHSGLINRIGRRLKISTKYGDQNLFSHFLSNRDTEIVYVRNIKNNLSYHGYVHSYSENDTISEIVLSTVKVYNYENSDLLYEVDRIYLSFEKDEIIIELAKLIPDVTETESASAQTRA